jgi:hypothetical protein
MFKFFKKKVNEKQEETVITPSKPKALTIDDIKDEDMMVAALIATIDYAEETKKDVRLISIKQIN